MLCINSCSLLKIKTVSLEGKKNRKKKEGLIHYFAFQERLCELELPIHLCQFFGKLTLMRKAKSGFSPKFEKCVEKEDILSVMTTDVVPSLVSSTCKQTILLKFRQMREKEGICSFH